MYIHIYTHIRTHRKEVIHEDHLPGHLSAVEEGGGKEEHVGNRVLKPHRHEGRDGKPDGKYLNTYTHTHMR